MALMALAAPLTMSAQEYDDIYYNPKKDNTVQTKSKKQSNYIKDFSSVDVDEYNRRGQYYSSPIDTIGSRVENDEDFVYTQQIQKYYNPTIVLDNSDVLADVLNNSYGNVEIVFNNGIPSFSPWYGYYDYGWPYYSSFGWNSWNWGWNSWNWGWGPSWSWNWGPSWNWSWGWGPSWSWGWNNPSWGWGHGRPYADYRPGGRLPNNPGSNWASNTRPGGNYNGHYGSNGSRPNTNGYNHNSGGIFGGSATNHHRTYGGSIQTSGNRNYGVGSNQSGSNRNGYTVNNNGHRTYNSSGSTVNSNNSNNSHRTYNNSSNRSNSNTTTRNSYNSNSSRGSYNSGGSFGGGRSSGGSYGGGRSSGGGGARGSHR